MTVNKIILFSGGIDSTILALQHAISLHHEKALLLHIKYEHPGTVSEQIASFNIYQKLIEQKHLGWDDRFEYLCLSLPIDAKNMMIGPEQKGSRVVPNRNAIMLNMAINVAVCNGAKVIEYGAVLDDLEDYVDCRPAFLHKMNKIAEDWGVTIKAPLMAFSKDEFLFDNDIANEILSACSSCYQPIYLDESWVSCGSCNSCISNNVAKNQQVIADIQE